MVPFLKVPNDVERPNLPAAPRWEREAVAHEKDPHRATAALGFWATSVAARPWKQTGTILLPRAHDVHQQRHWHGGATEPIQHRFAGAKDRVPHGEHDVPEPEVAHLAGLPGQLPSDGLCQGAGHADVTEGAPVKLVGQMEGGVPLIEDLVENDAVDAMDGEQAGEGRGAG